MINNDYLQEISQIHNLLDSGKIPKVINKTKKLLSQDKNNPYLNYNCAAIFIDCGSIQKDIELINLGVNLIEDILKKDEFQLSPNHSFANYTLSNGYSELAYFYQASGSNDAMKKALQTQKQLLQKVLLEKESLPEKLLLNVITNYANLLDNLGRTVEAVDHYYDCLEIDPSNATAMLNCGIALPRLENISKVHNPKILYEAWHLMKESSKLESNLVRLSGRHILPHSQNTLTNFEKYIESQFTGGHNALEDHILELEKNYTWEPSDILIQLKNDRFLLTVNPRLLNHPSEYKDDIFFQSMVMPLDDSKQQLFRKLVHIFNHVKEDFVTARYLYYQSQSKETRLIEVSSITSYMDTLDYADFGIRSGFLKTSLRLASDLLDKCAGFINLYLELNTNPNTKVYFSNIWYSDCAFKRGLHPEIESRLSSNQYLTALYDLNKDFSGGYPAPFKKLRNDATHNRLVLSWFEILEESNSMYSLNEFQTIVKFLLRMTKAAIIYMVGFVMIEEQEREIKLQNLEDKIHTIAILNEL